MTNVVSVLSVRLASAQGRCTKAAAMLVDADLVRHYVDTASRLERLRASIDRIPSAVIRLTEQLAVMAGHARFEAMLTECVDDIGRRTYPENAADILTTLNLSLRFAEYRLAGD